MIASLSQNPGRLPVGVSSRRPGASPSPPFETPQLCAALEWNPRPVDDPLQNALDAYILGRAPDLESQDEQALELSAMVVGWLNAASFATELNLPDVDRLQRRLDFARLMGPLRRMVGDHFRGRRNELRDLHNFLFSNSGSEFAPKPMMINGFGGSGKTTLVAKLLLDHANGRSVLDGRRGPFVFLDFDRPVLSPEEPATLLLEAARQIVAQSREPNPSAESQILSLESNLRDRLESRTDDLHTLGQLLTGSYGAHYFNVFGDLLRTDEWKGRPLLFVLDTFEDVQYHSQKVVEHIWSFLGELRSRVPQVRVIVSGRAPVRIEGQSAPFSNEVRVDELDQDAAVACLSHYAIPDETAQFIYSHVGGNPLGLRLAGDLVKVESERGFREFISTEFAGRLHDEFAQAVLFRRILGHIKSKDVKKLAHPGLTLRRITPPLIKEVLAKPCGIDVPNLGRAQELWQELARETGLVLQESADVLHHRPELRRQMIGLLRTTRPDQVNEIHKSAVAYYEQFEDDASRAEELYHRMCLNESQLVLDDRWRSSVEHSLRSAREELPEEALLYLASRSVAGFESLFVSSDDWRKEDLVRWERKTAQWARELIQQDRYEDVDKELRLRQDRSLDSPLFLLHARVLKSLARHNEARRVLERALLGWPPNGSQTERIDLLLLLVRVLLVQGEYGEAEYRLQVADTLVSENGSVEQQLQAATLAVRVVRDGTRASDARAILASLAGAWRESQFRAVPDLARRAAAELLTLDPSGAARIIRSVGLGTLEPGQQASLATALSEWDDATRTGLVRRENSTQNIASLVGLHTQHSATSNVDWKRWLETTTPDECGDRLARMLEQWAPITSITEAFQDILRGRDDVVTRRANEAQSAEQKLSRGDRVERFHSAIVSAFDHVELEMLFREKLDIRLDDIVSGRTPMRKLVYDVVVWFERHGQLRELATAVAAERPNRPDLQELIHLSEETQSEQ